MDIVLWILAIYLFTVAISYPFIKVSMRHNEEVTNVFNHIFASRVIAFVPIKNLYYAYHGFRDWLTFLKAARALQKVVDDDRDMNEEDRALLKSVISDLKGLSNLKEDEK